MNEPYRAFLILLANGRLWKEVGAGDAAVFTTREHAEGTIDGLSGKGALAGAIALETVEGPCAGARKIGGYWARSLPRSLPRSLSR